MQNPTPRLGTAQDRRFVPKSAARNIKGHEPLPRRRNALELEERVRRTESLLKAAGLLDEESARDELVDGEADQPDSESEHDNGRNEDISETADWGVISDNQPRPHALTGQKLGSTTGNLDRNSCPSLGPKRSSTHHERRHSATGCSDLQHVPVLRADDREESRYYGRSSFMSILSRQGIEWIKEKTGDVKFLNCLITDSNKDSPWDYWRPDVFRDLFASQVFKPLPSRAEVFSLMKDYFRTLNRLFPLYHEESFMRLVEWQYTQQTCDDAARWANINIILSLAYEYRFSNSLKPERDKEKAWMYFKNAMSVFVELTLRRTDLLSVQALLGMALFLRGNSGTQSALPIITAAMRSCHRMGLHRDLPRPHFSPVEQEQRKRVFWIAYILDQSTCVRSGSAPTQQVDDFDVDLPSEKDDDHLVDNFQSFFHQLCRLTVIKGRICCKLNCTKALDNRSVGEIFQIIDELNAELEEWKNNGIFDLQLKMKPAGEDFLFGFATAGLRLVYYNSLIMVHRIPLIVHFIHARHVPPERQKASDLRLIANHSAASATICLQAARDTLKLVNSLPWGDIAWIWSLLYYVFLAVITIFAHVMEDSRHPKAKEDVDLLNIASTFLGTLIPADSSCKYARFMAQMSANFELIARASIERYERAGENFEYRTSASATQSPLPGPGPEHGHNETTPSSCAQGLQCQDSGYVTSPASNVNMEMNIPRVENLPHSLAANDLAAPDAHNNEYHQPCQGMADHMSPNYTTTTNTQFYTNPANNLFPTNPTPTPTQTPSTDHIYPFSNPNSDPNPCTATSTPTDNCTGTGAGPCFVSPPPNLWQIPLTADWEFNQFLNGMPPGILPGHGTGTGTTTNANAGYPFDLSTSGLGINPGSGPAAVPQTPTPNPIDSGNIMGYDYGTQAQAQAQAQMQNLNQGQQQHQLYQQFMDAQTPAQVIDNVVWFGGFAGF
ncbi:hypothetical protein SI65_02042 [Aspergillus cristatus]|uniref:Xylanolytic transcriptional activator regulatory domain-containing protein n=1 Tax=Aspergillus cristatus TaxID=573508 RepID=A0A1E3BU03_ASPCR|nr:hypothetical protein SI65_02042 [Aspergillus cristatus]